MRPTPKPLAYALSGCLLLSAGSAILAAPEQQRPGQMTEAKVWVQNRARDEVMPVSLQDVAADASLRVQVVGTPTVALERSSVLQMRLVRQPWDYRTVRVRTDEDPAVVLSKLDDWETTGLQFPEEGGTRLLLKRPR